MALSSLHCIFFARKIVLFFAALKLSPCSCLTSFQSLWKCYCHPQPCLKTLCWLIYKLQIKARVAAHEWTLFLANLLNTSLAVIIPWTAIYQTKVRHWHSKHTCSPLPVQIHADFIVLVTNTLQTWSIRDEDLRHWAGMMSRKKEVFIFFIYLFIYFYLFIYLFIYLI